MTVRAKGKITDEDRQWWAFRPMGRPQPPAVDDHGWSVNSARPFRFPKTDYQWTAPRGTGEAGAIGAADLFRPHRPATFPGRKRRVRCRTPRPDAPAATAKLVDRLLASRHYGEQWARHWLDLVRYAESDGFKADDYRPHVWRYRDYVIAAFNDDKPYDRFVQEQLAGDELFPGDPEARTGTAFLRHGIYEYNNRDVATQWTNILNELTDVTADVFLGLGVQCARCHDHKFDPILQKDYYRLQAFFAPIEPRDDLVLATPAQEAAYHAALPGVGGKDSGSPPTDRGLGKALSGEGGGGGLHQIPARDGSAAPQAKGGPHPARAAARGTGLPAGAV